MEITVIRTLVSPSYRSPLLSDEFPTWEEVFSMLENNGIKLTTDQEITMKGQEKTQFEHHGFTLINGEPVMGVIFYMIFLRDSEATTPIQLHGDNDANQT